MIQSVDRALRLLAEVRDHPGISLSALSDRLGLLPSTASRLLSTLELHGLVERDLATKAFRLGPGALALSARVGQDPDLPRRLEPTVRRLAATAGEQCSLAVLEGREVVHLLTVDGAADAGEALVLRTQAGTRDRNLNATAVGKVLLAFRSPDLADAIIDHLDFTKTAKRTITDAATLRRHLDRVRRNGYAISIDENTNHVRGVAAPVLRTDGAVACGLAVHGPTIRLSRTRLRELAPIVCAAARECSKILGLLDDTSASTGDHVDVPRKPASIG